MSTAPQARRSPLALVRGAIGIAIVFAIWEGFAHSGMFSKAITPPLGDIFRALYEMLADGSLFKHAGATLLRLAAGMAIACVVAMPLALLMGRYRPVERALRPLLAVLMPIPSLAWVPLVVLWFGIGDLSTVLVVVYAASFPLLFNVWTGVRALNPLWVRAALTMSASETQLFRYVILPAALPYAITGIRLAFGRAWIAVIGGELLASPEWGLGKLIFDAKEFLNADVMLATLFLIGVLGILFERVVFKRLEAKTVGRWGMATTGRR